MVGQAHTPGCRTGQTPLAPSCQTPRPLTTSQIRPTTGHSRCINVSTRTIQVLVLLVCPPVGIDTLTNVTLWLEEKGYKAWIGEFGAANNELCHSAVDGMLSFMDQHSKAWLGWSWWAAGPWWGTAAMSIEPNADGSDKPQFSWLAKHFPPAPPTPPPTPDPCAVAWSKCGGKGWTGPTCCDAGFRCIKKNVYYSQCTPRTAVTPE